MSMINSASHPEIFPSLGTIRDRAGFDIDASGWVWKLNHPVSPIRIDFRKLGPMPPAMLRSTAAYIADRIAVASVDNVVNTFETLCHVQRSTHFQDFCAEGGVLGLRLIADMRGFDRFPPWRLHYVRAWYRWCAKRDMDHFSSTVLEEMEEFTFGDNPKGVAVATRDPEQGAFDRLEVIALIAKLNAIGSEVLTLFERALVWLFLALGSNPLAFALLRQGDLLWIADRENGNSGQHLLRVPRIKKCLALVREAFHSKNLNRVIGDLVRSLIEENETTRDVEGWPAGCAFPLFARQTPNMNLLDGPMHEFAMHLTPAELTRMLKQAVDKLDVISHRTGQKIHVNARRFRRTFATRAVEEHISPVELAIALDHKGLGTVQVYFETTSTIVERIDAAIAIKLGPIADAFMGRIVPDEAAAENGHDPSKRIPWFARAASGKQKGGNLGTCGSGTCNLLAPVSCYTCRKFQPWRDGPHREILDWLCDDRERKRNDGLDPQIYGIHDATILAIGEVVAMCEGETNS